MSRNKRKAALKGEDFYFGLRQGEFVIFDHDLASQLDDDLIDLGIQAKVQQY
jgi:hypothetical protein